MRYIATRFLVYEGREYQRGAPVPLSGHRVDRTLISTRMVVEEEKEERPASPPLPIAKDVLDGSTDEHSDGDDSQRTDSERSGELEGESGGLADPDLGLSEPDLSSERQSSGDVPDGEGRGGNLPDDNSGDGRSRGRGRRPRAA
jgi:hypothetical protein